MMIISKNSVSINSFNPHIKLINRSYIFILQMRNVGMEKISDFPKPHSKKAVETDPFLTHYSMWLPKISL